MTTRHLRARKHTKRKRADKILLAGLLLLCFTLDSQLFAEARLMGPVRTKNHKAKFGRSARTSIIFNESEAGLLLIDPPNAQSEAAKVRQRSPLSAPAAVGRTGVHTDVGELAVDFEAAIQAVKQQEHDIHVGRLLVACERLERTMKKIGFTQGAKDIGGNISKIRNLYNRAPPSQRDSMSDLLRYEIATGVHGGDISTRRLKDPSAAMGFLWLGRAINYQNDVFRLMLDRNEEPFEAARHAYDQDLKHHHSWAVQKVCQAAMSSLKPMKRTSVLSSLGGFEEDSFGNHESEATNRDLHQMMSSWDPMLCRWKQVLSDLELGSI